VLGYNLIYLPDVLTAEDTTANDYPMIVTDSLKTAEQLLQRCQAIAGLTLGQLAAQLQLSVPANLKRNKGWVGQLLEIALGAEAGSQAIPDFPNLGIELKTLPINAQGKPLESTYVCVAPLTGVTSQTWQQSWICQKLQHVLWVPILAERHIPVAERIIGSGFYWRPSPTESQALQQDWEELMELITLGGIDQIRGAHGKVLQLRPKAADSNALTNAVGANGESIQTLPRGFYLKASFTAAILQRQFGLAT
jgi:DNA mismatch repair protein MutH